MIKKIRIGKLWALYIRDRLKVILLLGVMAGIFAFVFSLYELPAEPVWYAILLCLFIGIIYLLLDFLAFRKKHHQLFKLQDSLNLSLDQLPPALSLPEEDYQELIRLLYEEKAQLTHAGDKAVREMVDYYTMWAHQVKIPISALSLLLNEENQDNSAMKAELFKIEQYVEMVLYYVRLESLASDYVLNSYDLDKIIRQAVRKYSRLFIQKGIALDYQGLNEQVLTDEKWFLFVIEQLLSNAIKYTKAGKISIYMRPGKQLVIEDTGIGIPKEDSYRIFEKGFTGYNGRLDKKSTGLGLYLSKRILTKLSHPIEVESQVDVGTKLIIGLERQDMRPE